MERLFNLLAPVAALPVLWASACAFLIMFGE